MTTPDLRGCWFVLDGYMMIAAKQGALILSVAIGLWVLYAYLLRFERLVIGRLRLRGAPEWGLAWPLVDAWRALTKRPSLPSHGRRTLLRVAPLLTCGLALSGLLSVPSVPNDVSASILTVLPNLSDRPLLFPLLVSLGSLSGTALFGWAARQTELSEQSRAIVSWGLLFWLPTLLSLAGVVLLSASLDLRHMVEAQIRSLPYLVYQPLGLLTFALSFVASGRRMPIAVQATPKPQLADFTLQHAGSTWALYHLGEYLHLLMGSALVTAIFAGGWWGPWRQGIHWFIAKMLLAALGLVWLRGGWLLRLQAHQLRALWVKMTLLSLGNLLLTAIIMLRGQ
ncbi:MAG: NADH-quinone oxidoreductase subunit H [Anaerolineae bacterium]|nr:NADH-quinone oxidoreductase subunit H [Anaerolineae bacterium]